MMDWCVSINCALRHQGKAAGHPHDLLLDKWLENGTYSVDWPVLLLF